MAAVTDYFSSYNASLGEAGYLHIPDQDCYIYISHLDEDHQVWLLPSTPETITDSMSSNFQDTNALGRSAPVYTYSNSGPRTVQVSIQLHRDMMDLININKVPSLNLEMTQRPSSTDTQALEEYEKKLTENEKRKVAWESQMKTYEAALKLGQDTVDQLIRALQSISVPKYNLDNRAVEPPLVALRLGKEVFIKGVVSGSLGVEYGLPILSNGKYAQVKITFSVNEVDPYDATTVFTNGSFRGMMSQSVSSRMGLGEV